MNGSATVILGSQSPRRHELLNLAGISHKVFVSGADEGKVEYVPGKPEEFVLSAAALKNTAVREALLTAKNVNLSNSQLTDSEVNNAIILSADTVVYSDACRRIFGKPGATDRAFGMLRELSGKCHRVITGVTLYDMASGKSSQFAESTDVYFRNLEDSEIERYLSLYNPLDKAGAYGIQDGACVFVEKIVGDYYNVVGLPLCKVWTELKKFRMLD